MKFCGECGSRLPTSAFDTQPHPEQSPTKAISEPVVLFKLTSAKAQSPVLDRQVSSAMVGRDRELNRLELQVMKVVNGEGSVVHISGEAGIRKSRLLAELRRREVMQKVALLAAGLQVSGYINVDDTGARPDGKNGYCTHIGNEFFSWFESTASKSRINFLQLLRAGRSDYWLNREALAYMAAHQLPQEALTVLRTQENTVLTDEAHWLRFLNDSGIVQSRQIQIATEGALLGSILEQGLSERLVIVSDDAGQFNVLLHALCWIQAERTINKVSPLTDQGRMDLEEVKTLFWRYLNDRLKNLGQISALPDLLRQKALNPG
jgi:hypothetical protein